jgi:hypothetical protein
MKLSDRDLKLLVLVLIAAVIVCPIFFLIKPFNEKIDSTNQHISQLKEREDFLAKLDANRAFYNSSIELLANERSKIVENFATGLIDENNVFFLAETEDKIGIALTTLNFAYAEPTPISEDSYDAATGEVIEGLTALTSLSTVEYICEYENMKDFLQYILDMDKKNQRMVLTSFSADQDDETGKIKGVFILNQYAVTGEGRELKPVTAESIPYGVDNVFGKPAGIVEEEAPAEE